MAAEGAVVYFSGVKTVPSSRDDGPTSVRNVLLRRTHFWAVRMKLPSLRRQFVSAIGLIALVVVSFWALESVADVLPVEARHAILGHYEGANEFLRADIVWMMRGEIVTDDSAEVDRRWCVCVDAASMETETDQRSLWLAERSGGDWRVRRVSDTPDYRNPAWTKYNCPEPGGSSVR